VGESVDLQLKKIEKRMAQMEEVELALHKELNQVGDFVVAIVFSVVSSLRSVRALCSLSRDHPLTLRTSYILPRAQVDAARKQLLLEHLRFRDQLTQQQQQQQQQQQEQVQQVKQPREEEEEPTSQSAAH
jgi:hypothetical protein